MIEVAKSPLAKFNADAIFVVSIVVARLQMGFMLLIEGAQFVLDPTYGQFVNQILPPKFVPWLFIGLGFITELAHARRRHNALDPNNPYNDSSSRPEDSRAS